MNISRINSNVVEVSGIDVKNGLDITNDKLEEFLTDEHLSEILEQYEIVVSDNEFQFLEARDSIVFQCSKETADELTK